MAARFKLFGIPVEVRPSFFLVAVMLGWPSGLTVHELLRVSGWVLVVTLSIFWHELGHALAMRAFGRGARIELYSLGGVTHWGGADDARPGPLQRVVVSLAGPLTGFAVGGAVLLSGRLIPPSPGTAWGTLSSYLLWVNVAWGALNLVPMLPLDGGNVLAAVLDAATKGRGRLASQVVSIVTALALCAVAVAIRWPWLALPAAWAGTMTFAGMRDVRAEARDEPLWDELRRAWELLGVAGTLEAGVAATEQVFREAQSARLRAAANEQLAWAWLLAGDAERAEAQLAALPGTRAGPRVRPRARGGALPGQGARDRREVTCRLRAGRGSAEPRATRMLGDTGLPNHVPRHPRSVDIQGRRSGKPTFRCRRSMVKSLQRSEPALVLAGRRGSEVG